MARQFSFLRNVKISPPDLLVPKYDDVVRYIKVHVGTDSADKNDSKRGTDESFEGCEECVNLFEDLREYHKNASELPNEKMYSLLAAWDFHTYAQEKSNFSPIIYFYSVAERGKSRTLKAMAYVAYRGIMKMDIRDAQLLRECTNLRATLLFDCTDFWKKAVDAGSEDVVLSRFERGITVTRVNRPEKGAFQDTDYYNVYGPTVIATNKIIDEIADTRSICIIMKKSKRDFENEVLPQDGQELKARLTAYRCAHYNNLYLLDIKKHTKIVSNRLGDIVRPLHEIVANIAPHKEEEFVSLIQEIKSKKVEDKSLGVNGEIIKGMKLCENLVKGGKIKNQLIVNEVNTDRTDRERIGAKTVSNLIRSMGFDPAVMADGSRGFFYNETLISELADEYGVVLPPSVSDPDLTVPSEVSEIL